MSIINRKTNHTLNALANKTESEIRENFEKGFSSTISLSDNRRRHFVTVGRPVGEVNKAEKKTDPGKIVMSPNAWDLCDKKVIIGEHLGERFFEIKFMRNSNNPEYSYLPAEVRGDAFDASKEDIRHLNMKGEEVPYIRKSMQLRGDIPALNNVVREYIMPVVKDKLQDQTSVKYLSELRQVTVVFINLNFIQKLQDKNFFEKQAPKLQQAFGIIDYEIVEYGGIVNKLFAFDKGCSVLAIFGLPGSKHDGEAAHALQASYAIWSRLNAEVDNLSHCSIGVTTGPVFVGVMGHTERHEYTIIGPKVNMAARIMMHYPKIVSTDTETKEQAKLAPWLYKPLPYIHLKGIANPGTIYKYSELLDSDKEYFLGTINVKEPKYPILAQDQATV